ncbi:hypothetical protein GCM10028806_54070 [Spirosoma terrae]|uniref:Uncharacterized protein n=1 Tax=Spirosoma terrae TaxID=1968276 RepID=A0A6L9LBK4_9BACT|nr:hypothetical protein [Spirosoma terrae]NDU96792.1 hypothetical protein [Spirosoma terrae]
MLFVPINRIASGRTFQVRLYSLQFVVNPAQANWSTVEPKLSAIDNRDFPLRSTGYYVVNKSRVSALKEMMD